MKTIKIKDIGIKNNTDKLNSENKKTFLYTQSDDFYENDLKQKEIKIYNRYNILKSKIEEYNDSYYNNDFSLISDIEYDKLMKELIDLEEKYPFLLSNTSNKNDKSPTQKIGGVSSDKFSKVEHRVPMLSLSNTYNIDEIKSFDKKIRKILTDNDIKSDIEYILELKLDGLSISLIYESGILTRAVTRGDGQIGEDVTDNVKQIDSIPHKLNKNIDVEVRGEIVFPISQFNKLNEIRKNNGMEEFSNPRNAAAGTIRQLDSKIVKERGLDCYLYYLVGHENYNIKTHEESIKFIEELGFKTTKIFEKYKNIQKMEKSILEWNSKRKKLDYETDGLVIKVNDFALHDILGYTIKSPRWAIAYKYQSEQVETKILNVTFQVGRTGVITPVAELEPVQLSGSIVKRASLHNFSEIYRKDIRLGDYVIIEKAAEIIPQVLYVVKEKRTGIEDIIEKPEHCPSCGSTLFVSKNFVSLKCLNYFCPEKIKRDIQYFVSRDAMNINGLGDKIIEKFINENYIKDVSDIYSLHEKRNELEKMDKMGKQSVDNLLNSIEQSKNNSFNKVFYSLGIQHVGKYTANLLTEHFNSIDDIKLATKDELKSIKGLGDKTIDSIQEYLNSPLTWSKISKLKAIGLLFERDQNTTVIEDNPIKNKNFLATGKLSKYKRNEIKDLIINKGGNYLTGISQKLDILICGEKPGSKLEKAKELGITVLTEDEFVEQFLLNH